MRKKAYISITLAIAHILTPWPAMAQEPKGLIRQGNRLYQDQKYTDAEESYRKAREKDPNSFSAAYNLGDALFKRKKYAEAAEQFQEATKLSKRNKDLGDAQYNLGNSLLKEKKWEESIEAFKKSLKSMPGQVDAQYNLSYALEMKKQEEQRRQQQQQQQQQQGGQQQQQQQDGGQKPQPNKPPTGGGNQQQQQQQQGGEGQDLSKEQADRILDALRDNEQRIRRRRDADNAQRQWETSPDKPW